MAAGARRKPVILCLHGLYQTGESFSHQILRLQQALHNDVRFVFATAPNEVKPSPRLQSLRVKQDTGCLRTYRAWLLPRADAAEQESAFQKSLDVIRSTIVKTGEVTGVLGFSQGATMCSLLCTHSLAHQLDFRPSLAVIASGHLADYLPSAEKLYSSGFSRDQMSLHSFGTNDQVTSSAESIELARLFRSYAPHTTSEHVHDGGHRVTESADFTTLLQRMLLSHQQHQQQQQRQEQ